jgi:hypothetical protein
MATTQEKLTDRVYLLAFGVLHLRDCMDRKGDLERALEILGEEFARVEAAGESLEELRAYLAERGVSVPEHVATSDSTEAFEKPDLSQDERVSSTTTNHNNLSPTVHSVAMTDAQEQERSDLTQVESVQDIDKFGLSRGTGSGTWRGWPWNRVPPAIEQATRERFAQGWSKSHLAREFRLNRRTVIRICASTDSPAQINRMKTDDEACSPGG